MDPKCYSSLRVKWNRQVYIVQLHNQSDVVLKLLNQFHLAVPLVHNYYFCSKQMQYS